jgi:phosphomethylpyrimidine synthase
MCGPHFCSMKITEEVRAFARSLGVAEDKAIDAGLESKAGEFRREGAEVYRKV